MHRRSFIAALAALALGSGLVAGCSGAPSGGSSASAPASKPATATASAATASAAATISVVATGSAKAVKVRLVTSKGVVKLELYPAKAPVTVANFVKLVKARFYDGLLIHRVEAGFVVQAGDPLTRGMSAKRLKAILARAADGTSLSSDPQVGTGGPGWTIQLETNDLVHDRGVIAMARSQDPNSAGSQFYITLGAAHNLDGQYTVFGRVTSGMKIVDRLAIGDAIRSIRVIGN
jgi:peptidyl-prolyl cis-trans isomerase B (cyclophilin B)